MLSNLGIIAGSGVLPQEIARLYSKAGGKCYIAVIDSNSDINLFNDYIAEAFKYGQVSSLIDFFKTNAVENIIFIGGIKRPNLRQIKPDIIGAKLLAKILAQKFLGDDKILRVIADFFELHGFQIISPKSILSQSNIVEHHINHCSKQNLLDIELGKKVLSAIGYLDIGQSVIVEDGHVIGIEAAEGTDDLIDRCANLRQNQSGGVLIKMLKKKQNIFMDLPTIGPQTIYNLAKNQYNGIAIETDSVIVAEEKKTFDIAKNSNIFIYHF